MKWAKVKGTYVPFRTTAFRRENKGGIPMFSTVSPQPGAQKQVQDNSPPGLWCVFLCNGFAELKLSFAFCLSAPRFLVVLVPFLLVLCVQVVFSGFN